jgi:hypothetical protein
VAYLFTRALNLLQTVAILDKDRLSRQWKMDTRYHLQGPPLLCAWFFAKRLITEDSKESSVLRVVMKIYVFCSLLAQTLLLQRVTSVDTSFLELISWLHLLKKNVY